MSATLPFAVLSVLLSTVLLLKSAARKCIGSAWKGPRAFEGQGNGTEREGKRKAKGKGKERKGKGRG